MSGSLKILFVRRLHLAVVAKVSVWDLDLIPVSGAVLFFAISGSAETGTKTEQTSVKICVSGTI